MPLPLAGEGVPGKARLSNTGLLNNAEAVGANLCPVRNLDITILMALYVHGSWIQPIADIIVLYCIFIEKNLLINEPSQLKPVVFKG